MGYTFAPKWGHEGRFHVFGGEKPYVVTLHPEWRGARCSCPVGIFKARKTGIPCKHEAFVRAAIAAGSSVEAAAAVRPPRLKKAA